MRNNFKSYVLAVAFYRLSHTLQIPCHLREQLNRASASIVLNLAEGEGRASRADQKRFFTIAFASLRECQAILDLMPRPQTKAIEAAELLAAHIYRLIQSCGG